MDITDAILKRDPKSTYPSGGSVNIEDPSRFEFKIDAGHNNGYNFFFTFEFLRDYPPIEEYEKKHNAEWTGSGFAITNGYIATNYHVINGAKSIRIKGIDGNMKISYKAAVIAEDKEHDLSILRIIDKDFKRIGSIPYKIGKTVVDVGNDIFVLGYPLVSSMGEEIKLTNGIISSSSGYKGDDAMYQISAAVQPGNSGGPVFDSEGTVIGIVCAKHSDAENANYAVKISYLYNLLDECNLNKDIGGHNINSKGLSKKVKKIKDYVYIIECSGK